MAIVAVIVGGGTLLVVHLVRSRSARATMLAALVVFTGLVFAVQDQAGWAWQIDQSRVWRDGFPDDLSWIDHATDKDLARMVVFYNPYRTPQTELFNRRITRTYVPSTPVGGNTGQRLHLHLDGGAERRAHVRSRSAAPRRRASTSTTTSPSSRTTTSG